MNEAFCLYDIYVDYHENGFTLSCMFKGCRIHKLFILWEASVAEAKRVFIEELLEEK